MSYVPKYSSYNPSTGRFGNEPVSTGLSTVIFNGTTSQTISCSGTTKFNNFTFSDSENVIY